MDIFEKLSLAGLVPVIKVEDANDAVPLCRALSEGGLPVAEITFRTAAAEQAIRNVSSALPEVILGAGTVLSVDQVKRAVDAGAKFIVSPGLNPAVVGYCVENHIPVLPGCANPSDIETAMSFGLDTVKFFPAEAAGRHISPLVINSKARKKRPSTVSLMVLLPMISPKKLSTQHSSTQ